MMAHSSEVTELTAKSLKAMEYEASSSYSVMDFASSHSPAASCLAVIELNYHRHHRTESTKYQATTRHHKLPKY